MGEQREEVDELLLHKRTATAPEGVGKIEGVPEMTHDVRRTLLRPHQGVGHGGEGKFLGGNAGGAEHRQQHCKQQPGGKPFPLPFHSPVSVGDSAEEAGIGIRNRLPS